MEMKYLYGSLDSYIKDQEKILRKEKRIYS